MLAQAVDWVVYTLAGLDPDMRWAAALDFFVYDTIKILLLLVVMITAVGFLRTYLPAEKIKQWLSKKRYGSANITAALFGALTPFCSCSSIPLFLSFLRSGVPLGVALSFLITSPLVNEYLVVLMLGFFGWKIALAYVLSGVLIGVGAGLLLGKSRLEKQLEGDFQQRSLKKEEQIRYASIGQRVRAGFKEAQSIIRKLWLWIIVGVGIGALIHNYIPEAVIQSLVSKGGVLAVPIAVLIGVPMYGSCAAIVPIAIALFDKGVPLGTALAFMMATSALSFPEAVILRRAMRLRLIALFFGIVAAAIVLTGYVFNALQGVLV